MAPKWRRMYSISLCFSCPLLFFPGMIFYKFPLTWEVGRAHFLQNLPSLKKIQFDLSQFEWFDNPENMSLNVLNLMCLKMTGPWPRLRLRHPPLLLPSRLQLPPPPNASRYGTVLCWLAWACPPNFCWQLCLPSSDAFDSCCLYLIVVSPPSQASPPCLCPRDGACPSVLPPPSRSCPPSSSSPHDPSNRRTGRGKASPPPPTSRLCRRRLHFQAH
jgi:hypothetical protein